MFAEKEKSAYLCNIHLHFGTKNAIGLPPLNRGGMFL